MTREFDAWFMTFNSRGNLHSSTPEEAIVAAQTFLMTTQPEDGPRAQVHRTQIAGLNIAGQNLENTPRRHENHRLEGPSGESNAGGHEVAAPNNSTRQLRQMLMCIR
jgi:hypothetical protein